MKIQIVEREDLLPKCPHCKNELPEVFVRSRGVGFVVGKTQVYFCPHCQTVLGFAQSRMI